MALLAGLARDHLSRDRERLRRRASLAPADPGQDQAAAPARRSPNHTAPAYVLDRGAARAGCMPPAGTRPLSERAPAISAPIVLHGSAAG